MLDFKNPYFSILFIKVDYMLGYNLYLAIKGLRWIFSLISLGSQIKTFKLRLPRPVAIALQGVQHPITDQLYQVLTEKNSEILF